MDDEEAVKNTSWTLSRPDAKRLVWLVDRCQMFERARSAGPGAMRPGHLGVDADHDARARFTGAISTTLMKLTHRVSPNFYQ